MPREPMPMAQDMPEVNGRPEPQQPAPAAPGGEAEKSNPVVEALQTVAAFIAALKEKGDPKAAQAMQHLQGLLQVLTGGAGAEEAPPEQPEAPQGPQAEPMGKGKIRSMEQGGAKNAAPIM